MKRFNFLKFHTAIFCSLGVAILTHGMGGICFSQEQAPSKPSSQPVSQELQLAKPKSLYVVVDTTKNLVFLKARGVPLRTFPLTQAKWIGNPPIHSTVMHLDMKDPSVSPIPITPPSDSSSESPPEEPTKPLTVNDMPHRYELAFQEHLTILVQTPPPSLFLGQPRASGCGMGATSRGQDRNLEWLAPIPGHFPGSCRSASLVLGRHPAHKLSRHSGTLFIQIEVPGLPDIVHFPQRLRRFAKFISTIRRR